MNVASGYYGDQFNRQKQAYDTNMERALGERDFGYGQAIDEYGLKYETWFR